ncbi:hypothetical protein [Enterobacter mori]|uniref:hypothetical protein n=1 Tax=Enterobacter mori TaxID=539813 RepID=UPI001B8D2BDD|nr:hypothetical protein [Enterobacter mori]MBS3050500.1 hypothetical protein [Enterobacter mori]
MFDVINTFANVPTESKDQYIRQMAPLPKPVEIILPFFAKLSLPGYSKKTKLDTSSLGKMLAPNIYHSNENCTPVESMKIDLQTVLKDIDVSIDFATRLITQRAASLKIS